MKTSITSTALFFLYLLINSFFEFDRNIVLWLLLLLIIIVHVEYFLVEVKLIGQIIGLLTLLMIEKIIALFKR